MTYQKRGGGFPALLHKEMTPMMKIYKCGDYYRQYEEGKQPEGAIEVKKPAAEKEKASPANKARRTTKNK